MAERGISVIYFGRSCTYNLAYANALSNSGYDVISKNAIDSDIVDKAAEGSIFIVDSLSVYTESIEALLFELKEKHCISIVIVSDDEIDSYLSVRFFNAGAGDIVPCSGDPEVFLARLGVLISSSGAEVPKALPKVNQDTDAFDVGTIVDHYRLDLILGIGGMGVVYKAFDTKLERMVALKILPSGVNLKKSHVNRFMREAEIMAHLNIPEAVKIYDFGTDPINYIVMEIISGEDLESKMLERLFTPAEAVRIVSKLAKAFFKIHCAGVIHRDLKPSNILFDSKGNWKILDFGVSKLVDAELSLTKPGAVLGTPAYMAPEQVEEGSGEIDARTDIYALGLILYEMIIGDLPFIEKNFISILKEIVFGNPISIRRERSDIDVNLDKIIQKATNRKQKDRFQTMEEFAKALDRLDLTLPGYNTAGTRRTAAHHV